MQKILSKVKILIILLVVFSVGVVPFRSNFEVRADALQDQLDELNKQISDIQKQKDLLQSQVDSNSYTIAGYSSQLSQLYGEAELYQKQIDELVLQIKQMELQIEQINNDIEQKRKDIQQAEGTVSDLEKESNSRIRDGYMNFRMYGSDTDDSSSILNLSNINAYFKTSQYKEIIQSGTNDILVKLAELKQNLQDKKQALDDQLVEVKKDKEVIDIKKVDLSKKKEEADVKVANYLASINALNSQNNDTQTKIYAFSQDEAEKRKQANDIQFQIMNNYVPTEQGQYVISGTILGRQGCTGLCTGAHLHFMVYVNGATQDPCSYLPGGVVNGCGWGNTVQWPLKGDIYYTSAYGYRCFWWGNTNYCDFHTGADFVGSPWNSPVYAAHDGYVHKGVDQFGANYIILCQSADCTGLKTGYWHLSEY